MRINPNEFEKTLGKRIGVKYADAKNIVSNFVDLLTDYLKDGNEVYISKLGIFSIEQRNNKGTYYDVKAKEMRPFAPYKVLHIRMSSVFKNRINQKDNNSSENTDNDKN